MLASETAKNIIQVRRTQKVKQVPSSLFFHFLFKNRKKVNAQGEKRQNERRVSFNGLISQRSSAEALIKMKNFRD